MNTTHAPGEHRILVGYDGSTASMEALEWAACQCELTGAEAVVYATWRWPTIQVGFGAVLPAGFDPGADLEQGLDATLREVRRVHPGVSVRGVVVEGDAGLRLVAASKEATLLVVGTRGHGEVVGALLGSVSEYCVTHAHCPVVVVREGRAVAPLECVEHRAGAA